MTLDSWRLGNWREKLPWTVRLEETKVFRFNFRNDRHFLVIWGMQSTKEEKEEERKDKKTKGELKTRRHQTQDNDSTKQDGNADGQRKSEKVTLRE